MHQTSSIDWLLMGIFKGVTCRIAEILSFDDMAIKSSRDAERERQSVFRKAAHCFVMNGDDRVFEIKLSYYESTTPLDHSSDD